MPGLQEDLLNMAVDDIPELFEDIRTHTVRVERPSAAPGDWGETVETSSVTDLDIPAVVEERLGTKAVLGQEYLAARIRLPAIWMGQAVDLRRTDRIRVLGSDGNNPERLFEVADIQNVFGVYLDVGVTGGQ